MPETNPLVQQADPLRVVLDMLKDNKGVAIGERHGELAIIEFATNHMQEFAAAGVKKFFIEMLPSRHQPAVDHFNKTGDEDAEFPLNPHLGEPVNSRWEVAHVHYGINPWDNKFDGIKEKYLQLMRAARANGIEIIGMDGYEGGGHDRLKLSNPHWAAIIKQHTADMKPGEKYLAYGGYYHFTAQCFEDDQGERVNRLVDPPIPSIRMDSTKQDKAYMLTQLGPDEAEAVLLLPESKEQTRESSYLRHDDFAYQHVLEAALRENRVMGR